MLKMVIPLQPITKKNSQRILQKYSRNKKSGQLQQTPFIAPSERYKQYELEAGYFIKGRGMNIDKRVNVKCLFYMQTKRMPDLNNLLEAVTDMLVHYNVLKDDNANIVAAHDGSRVRYDKANPRTEIYITEMSEDDV